MARVARAGARVALEPAAAAELWADVTRWPSFVEGFGHVVSLDPDWPRKGAKVVWQSVPDGRGRVTESVLEHRGLTLRTQVFEEALAGRQTARFEPAPGGSVVDVQLEYDLARYGRLSGLADLIFIRRALRDALRRTLRRFSVEAEEEADLR